MFAEQESVYSRFLNVLTVSAFFTSRSCNTKSTFTETQTTAENE